MISKKQVFDSISNELRLINHLYTKLTPQMMDYRPIPEMRSTTELLRYLTICGSAVAKCMLAESWDLLKAYREESEKLAPADFPAAMEKQLNELKEVFAEMTDEQFDSKQVKYPWGGTDTLGIGLVNTSLKFLTAYRMQLFIYAKQAGNKELTTMNNWGGVDAPRK